MSIFRQRPLLDVVDEDWLMDTLSDDGKSFFVYIAL